MACACKVNQQIESLHKNYGHDIPVKKRELTAFNVVETLKALGIWIVAIPIIPVMIVHILFKSIFTKSKTISVKKLMRLSKVS